MELGENQYIRGPQGEQGPKKVTEGGESKKDGFTPSNRNR